VQPPDDLVQVEQELQESLQNYIVVIKDDSKPAPIQYVKVVAFSIEDAIKETKKIVPNKTAILKVYPEK
jgi:hypothetical protein